MRYLLATLLIAVLSLMLACQDSDSADNTPAPAQSDTTWTWDKFYAQVETTDVNSRSALVDSFLLYWQAQNTIPPVSVPADSAFGKAVFVYRSTANSAQVAGDFNGWNPSGSDNMQRINGTTLFYLEKRFESNARFDYKFIVNGNNWILDPLNPRTQQGGFGPNSEMWMPAYHEPVEAMADTSIAHGSLQTFSITSTIMSNARTVSVYLPASYDTSQSYRVLYCHDGNDYKNLGAVRNIADYMIAHQRVEPFIVVFVPWAEPPGRTGEYHMNPNFANFFTQELIPYIDSHFATDTTAEGRAIVGCSSSGLGSVYLAFTKPQFFRNCIGQSGYYSYNSDALIHSVENSPSVNVSFFIEVGTYESSIGGGTNLYNDQQRLAAALQNKGYDYNAVYVPDGHSWGNWQRTLPQALDWIW